MYHPEYPEVLISAIATRLESIVEKGKRGEELTEEEKDYWRRSQTPETHVWDYETELKNQETIGKCNVAMKRLEELKTE